MRFLGRLLGFRRSDGPRLDVAEGDEEYWGDCAFEAVVRDERIDLRALQRGEVVGFSVLLPARWEASDAGWRGPVSLHSRGAESDRFVRGLAARFGMADVAGGMAGFVPFVGIVVSGDPAEREREDVRLLLRFAPDDAARRAEVFLDLRLGRGRVELVEKEESQRANLLRALREGDPVRSDGP